VKRAEREVRLSEVSLKPVVVDGADGFLGRAVAKALVASGIPVRGIVVDPGAKVPDGVDVAVAPLGDKDAIRTAVEGARAVVAARKLLEERPSEGITFKAVHAERTGQLLGAAVAAEAERFLYIGIAGLKDESQGILAEAELAAEALLKGEKISAVSLRPSLVVGPGDGHVSRMAAKARSGSPVMVFVGQGWARSAPMTAADFGECAARLLLGDDFPTEPLSIGGPELLTVMEIQDRLLGMRDLNKLKVHVPESIARLGAKLIEKTSSQPSVTRARLSWLLEDFIPDRVMSTKILGPRPEKFEKAFPELQSADVAQEK
jgi:NADH dehydrogenase